MATPEEEETAAAEEAEEVVTMRTTGSAAAHEESLFLSLPLFSFRASKIEKESKTKRVCVVLNLPAIN